MTEFTSWYRQDLIFVSMCRQVVGHQFPIQWVLEVVVLGVKQLQGETGHSPPHCAKVKNVQSVTFIAPIHHNGLVHRQWDILPTECLDTDVRLYNCYCLLIGGETSLWRRCNCKWQQPDWTQVWSFNSYCTPAARRCVWCQVLIMGYIWKFIQMVTLNFQNYWKHSSMKGLNFNALCYIQYKLLQAIVGGLWFTIM
jgi:hypothetical protein